ncbi:MAG: hypothetical protein RL591_271, partial [Planctomycetota bacterium]
MTACNITFSYSIEAPLPAQPNDTAAPLVASADPQRPLLERLAARISSGTDEIAPFATVSSAARAIALTFLLGRRVGLAATQNSPLSQEARLCARSTRTLDVTSDAANGATNGATSGAASGATSGAANGATSDAELASLIEFAREVDVLVLEAPQLFGTDIREPLTPRQLLELRARSPRTLIVLDLLNEDLARTPLTQAALLIPGTLVLRGFGSLWAAEGAATVAELAFVAGAPTL